jgi:hypothetical protein
MWSGCIATNLFPTFLCLESLLVVTLLVGVGFFVLFCVSDI